MATATANQVRILLSKFNGRCTRCGTHFPAGTKIEWAPGAGARHVACPAATPAPAPKPTVSVGSFAGVIALFKTAQAVLKYPKVTLLCEGVKVTLSVAGAYSKAPGTVSVVGEGSYPNRAWYGRVTPAGEWMPSARGTAMEVALTALLREFSANPAQVAKEHGRLTGSCCFCNKTLGKGEDKRSIAVGYGPKCAENFGLKDEWLKGAAAAASVAENLDAEMAAMEAEGDRAQTLAEETAKADFKAAYELDADTQEQINGNA